MMPKFIHQLLIVCCLVAMCFEAVAGAGMVRCMDRSGATRLEWGCERNDSGSCQEISTNHDATVRDVVTSSIGCVDELVFQDAGRLVSRNKSTLSTATFTHLFVLNSLFTNSPAPCALAGREAFLCLRLPQQISNLQTIVMLI